MPRTYYSDSEDEYVLMPVRSHAGGSEYRGRRRPARVIDRVQPEEVVINNHLVVPGGARPRASSTGGGPAHTTINIAASDRGGHSRSRSRHRGGYESRSSSSDYRSRSRHRRPESKVYEDDLAYSLRKELDLARERRNEDKSRGDRDLERTRWRLEEEEKKLKRQKEREAILLEAKLEEERKKKAEKELRERILKDEEERQKKEKEKKKAEEDEFERKVKEKFMNAGMLGPPYPYGDRRYRRDYDYDYDCPEYVEEILHKKKQERASSALAIDLHRPTFIKVNRKYLHPDTLDYYGLPWEWDSRDTEYIIIKKYIDNTFQDELFEHTRRLKERKLITGPYVKETKTITTLTPNDHSYVKRGDKMYIVREKSKSPGRSHSHSRRSSWMFS
ncbi:hypothetical protein LTR67_000265 [Exophiala xenobiotica]|nr:hypothetical protein H2202_003247 [Exophiala xenobiotica]KAK5210872.1 hypothetical protein LTR41_003484 [Exophiala xenobiotica]KAK5237327.1 hypothetical protein LTR47_001593 [Exophiala xenobiotica]KAK5248451.1 hypothetical protein LTS06_006524 [Exophiala xenobiotica]KAK5331789.1 hypothetical protein LTR93_000794 [Exophiala xenobiotica]